MKCKYCDAEIDPRTRKCKCCGKKMETSKGNSKRRTWLWVLGWIFIFPLPLTIILFRRNDMKKEYMYGLAAAVWGVYLVMMFFGGRDRDPNRALARASQTDTQVVQQQTEPATQAETTAQELVRSGVNAGAKDAEAETKDAQPKVDGTQAEVIAANENERSKFEEIQIVDETSVVEQAAVPLEKTEEETDIAELERLAAEAALLAYNEQVSTTASEVITETQSAVLEAVKPPSVIETDAPEVDNVTKVIEPTVIETTPEDLGVMKITLNDISVSSLNDNPHEDSDDVYLDPGEGFYLCISVAKGNVSENDIFFAWDDDMLDVSAPSLSATRNETKFTYRILGRKAGRSEIFVCPMYDWLSEEESALGYMFNVVQIAAQETPQKSTPTSRTVYITPTGKKYHFSPTCPGKNATPISLDEAIAYGYGPCKKCAH